MTTGQRADVARCSGSRCSGRPRGLPGAFRHRDWSELSRAQRAGIIVAGTVQVALQLVMLLDLVRRPADQVRGDKRTWVLASFLNFAGPIAYFTRGRRGAAPR